LKHSIDSAYSAFRPLFLATIMNHTSQQFGDMNWGGGSFAPSHNLTAVYTTFPNSMIQKFFPSFGDTLFTQYH